LEAQTNGYEEKERLWPEGQPVDRGVGEENGKEKDIPVTRTR